MKRKHETEGVDPGSVSPEGVEPAGDLGPETSIEAADGSSLITELERLRGREDELLRALAEQQNVVRRRRQEMESSVQYAQESLVRDLLPVLDDFERALKAMGDAGNDSMRAALLKVISCVPPVALVVSTLAERVVGPEKVKVVSLAAPAVCAPEITMLPPAAAR